MDIVSSVTPLTFTAAKDQLHSETKMTFSAPSSEVFCQSDTQRPFYPPHPIDPHASDVISLSLMCQFAESFTAISAKPLVSCVPVVLRMSERVIGLPASGFKKLLSSPENQRQPVKTGERWRCQMLLRPLQHWSVNKSHHYQTAKRSLNVENQTNSSPIYRYC